jgi:hypothetical protein
MKTFLVSAIAALAIVYHPQAYGQAAPAIGPTSIKLGKIEPAGVKTPEYQITGGPQKRSKIGTWLEVEVEFETKVEEVDELTFNYMVQIEGKLLVGNVTHVNIPGGKDHFSVVYISPRSLEKLVGNKPLTGASIQNVWVTVTRQGQNLAAAAMKPGNPPNLPQTTGMILNKSETPFAPLFYDRYEAVKATH